MSRRILLHICCAPCAIHPVRILKEEGFEVTGLFYNPNIQPASEYLRRRDTLAEFRERLGINVIWKDDEYDPVAWLRGAAFREESRCRICYRTRLERTVAIARRGGFEAFSTTLLYSKFQKHEAIAELGRDVAGEGKTRFLYRDFREGWREGVDTSREWGMYRQDYCGCVYSEFERRSRELARPPEG